MTKSIQVSFSGLFILGRLISETRSCFTFRCMKSTNTSVRFETHGESIGLDQSIEGRLKSPKRMIDALALVNIFQNELIRVM